MGFNVGIVGLPNVGKSTLFNALTSTAAAQAANYPFCTIEPNIGRVGVPDERLEKIAAIAQSAKIIPTTLEFVDIAGLVKGASKGEGLGNQFLGHIRSVDAIVHVLRCFEDDNITHVEDSVDPLRDMEIIETELLLADLESLTKKVENLQKKIKAQDKLAAQELEVAKILLDAIEKGTQARNIKLSLEQAELAKSFHLLTLKPVLYVCNVAEKEAATGNNLSAKIVEKAGKDRTIIISAAIEAEIASLKSDEEKSFFLAEMGLSQSGLHQIVAAGYGLLNLLTFFTVGPKEARAWTLTKGLKAPQAAGVIHTDFERGFICADTISYADYVNCKGEQGAKEAGKMRQEGRDYLVQDGDIFHFKFNV